MKTWKSKRTVCRSRKSGRFVGKKKCGQFKRSRVKVGFFGSLFGLALITLCLSCAAMPPASKNFRLQVTAGTGGDAVNFYAAKVTDTNWQLVATVPATNGQTFTIPLPAGDVFTADTTNTIQRTASDYAPICTNNLPRPPVVGW